MECNLDEGRFVADIRAGIEPHGMATPKVDTSRKRLAVGKVMAAP
jgi:hypothetical protein